MGNENNMDSEKMTIHGYRWFCFPLPDRGEKIHTARLEDCVSWFCFPLPEKRAEVYAAVPEIPASPRKVTKEESSGKREWKNNREWNNTICPQKPGGALREGWQIRDSITRLEKLRGITFLDFISPEADGKWDVSEKGDDSVMAWLDKRISGGEEYWELYIGAEGGMWAAADSSSLFQGCGEVEKISFNGNLNTSRTANMSWMFSYCDSLRYLDVSSFDTSQVTDMTAMFSCCDSLTSLDVSGFDTSQVTGMSHMFSCCGSLTSLDVSGFHTSRVMDMSYMFDGCSSLENLDISNFDMSRVSLRKDMLRGTKAEWPKKRK